MSITVRVPTPLRSLTGGLAEVEAEGGTLRQVVEDLDRRYPGIAERLVDERGIRRFVNLYVGDEDARFLGGLDAEVADGATVSIVPAIAGGAGRERC